MMKKTIESIPIITLPQEKQMDDDMSELIQYEYDHLDGVLATMRAVDNKSFVMKK